ncbi:hypothetical protein AKJ09_06541 [Labilithrix luteola]|uniref:Histidine kinase/HSP90-like ATPase domain-containing protein n=1 Tax=Labilithrix luteola TaxID=1391654 RepID=A0A0K1Q2B9_9BACT|nr:ATP-binding protein [Labilithrix luteola]AKU99877.1 hypothetical protein AKJ09_06541 [Labilithrix luteola]
MGDRELAEGDHGADHAHDASEVDDDDAVFELRFTPSVALVATVRRFVSDFYAQMLGDDDLSGRLAMATHEMLENTVHYSSDGKGSLEIFMKRRPQRVDVCIKTRNRAEAEVLARAKEALDGVVGAEDPNAHYLALCRRAAKRSDGGSGLGLGRIRAEADLGVSYSIGGEQLTIRVEGSFDVGNPPPPTLA